MEYLTQKYIEKRDKIDVKAILYEGAVGGVGAVIGGVGGTVKKAKTLKQVTTGVLKTGAKEAVGGFVENVSRQILVEGKPFEEVDWGEAKKTAAIAGISGMAGDLADFPKAQLNAKNKTSISQITSLMDDATDIAPLPKTKTLPEAKATPSHKTVKNAAGGLADARVSTGNVSRKSTTTTLSKDKLKNAKKSSPSLSKNQQKMQSQTVGSTLSGNTIPENHKYSLSNVETRKWYLEQEKKIPDMINKNLSLEKQAKQAFNLRNQFRTQARELMADRELAESLYKTKRNKTWKEIVEKQVNRGYVGDDIYKEIIASVMSA